MAKFALVVASACVLGAQAAAPRAQAAALRAEAGDASQRRLQLSQRTRSYLWDTFEYIFGDWVCYIQNYVEPEPEPEPEPHPNKCELHFKEPLTVKELKPDPMFMGSLTDDSIVSRTPQPPAPVV